MANDAETVQLRAGDALIVADIQMDFLPGGTLAVRDGERIIPVINRYIDRFRSEGLYIFATRDWHTPDHSSFAEYGGPWPPHCVAGTKGADFSPDLRLPRNADVISKATEADKDAYSGFEGTDLHERLRSKGIERLFIGGLTTDYCVLNSVKDGLKLGYKVFLLSDGIKAVNVKPDDGEKAIEEMKRLGALPIRWEMLG